MSGIDDEDNDNAREQREVVENAAIGVALPGFDRRDEQRVTSARSCARSRARSITRTRRARRCVKRATTRPYSFLGCSRAMHAPRGGDSDDARAEYGRARRARVRPRPRRERVGREAARVVAARRGTTHEIRRYQVKLP